MFERIAFHHQSRNQFVYSSSDWLIDSNCIVLFPFPRNLFMFSFGFYSTIWIRFRKHVRCAYQNPTAGWYCSIPLFGSMFENCQCYCLCAFMREPQLKLNIYYVLLQWHRCIESYTFAIRSQCLVSCKLQEQLLFYSNLNTDVAPHIIRNMHRMYTYLWMYRNWYNESIASFSQSMILFITDYTIKPIEI